MTSLKYPWDVAADARPTPTRAGRRVAAALLRRASAVLARAARRLATPPVPSRQPLARLEFYAEAGAPEGALFVDGEFAGRVHGVPRL